MKRAESSKQAMALEEDFGAHNYHSIPVVAARGEGVNVWDIDGKHYLDFLSAYSAVNQGHCHPKIIGALIEQAKRLTLISRAFYSDSLGAYEELATSFFGYERLLPMNTGVEAVETAVKLCRKWAYQKRGFPVDQARIIVCADNFHGRTMTAISASTSSDSRNEYGPFLPGFIKIPFNDIPALEEALKQPHVAGFLVEPIQGEAGIVVPADGYLSKAAALVRKAGALFIADEVQTGIARTGRMLACDHDGVKPDILILGKALSGGVLPVSAVLSSSEILLCIQPGEHGSTFGGNPLACQVAMAALEVVRDEKLAENAARMGEIFRTEMGAFKHERVEGVRGRGLLNAVLINPRGGKTGLDVCLALARNGVLAKPTRDHIIRFAPPLVINEEQMRRGIAIIQKSIREA